MSIGIKFPFEDDPKGSFLATTKTSTENVKSLLLHILLTEKNSRLYLPNFGTDLLKFIFEPNDDQTYEDIRSSLQEDINKWIPNIAIKDIIVEMDDSSNKEDTSLDQTITDKQGSIITKTIISGKLNTSSGQAGHSISVKIDYTITEGVFSQSDSLILRF